VSDARQPTRRRGRRVDNIPGGVAQNGESRSNVVGERREHEPDDHQSPRGDGLPSRIEPVLSAVAPVTLITALLIYLGYTTSKAYYTYFGISQSLLSISMDSYVLASADVTFGSSVRLVAAIALLVLLEWTATVLRRSRVGWLVADIVGAVAVLAILSGFYFAFGGARPQWLPPIALPITLAFGSLLLIRQLATTPPLLRGATASVVRSSAAQLRLTRLVLAALLVLATFWMANLYAVESGRDAARTDDSTPGRLPLVTVFSKEFLDLPGSAVKKTEIVVPGQQTQYRYSGLRLLRYANERWFLITGTYGDQYASPVAVLRDDSSIRVEVAGVRRTE
jgi:hypothetical protein